MGEKDGAGGGHPEEPEKTAAMDLADLDLEPEEDEEEVEKTGAMSLDDLKAAGLLDEEESATPAEESGSPEKTQAMALDDMQGPDEGSEESGPPEKTQAMALDDMQGPDEGGEESGPPEKTQAMTLDDMQGAGGAEEDGGQATMMLESPVQQGPAAAPRAPTRPARLEVVGGNDQGRSFDLDKDALLVGRGLDCDVVLNDASVSRKHFRLEKTAGGWRLVDLGSGNGTKVDGRRVQQEDLRDGATLEAGQTTLRWHAEEAPPEPAAPPAAERTMALDASGADFKGFGEEEEEDRTRIGDMAALEVLPEWAEREAAGRETSHQVPAPPPKKGGAGKAVGLAVGAVLILGGGFLAADKLAGLGVVFDAGDESAETTKAPIPVKEGPDPEAVALVEEGMAAFKDERWYDARARFREAVDVDPEVRGGEAGLAGAEAEIEAWKAFETADKALEEKEFREAMTNLREIDDTSSYYPQAQDLLKQARDGLVQQQLAKARELEAEGKLEEAKAAVAVALEVAPEDTSLLSMQNQLAHAEAEPKEEAEPKARARPRRRKRPRYVEADFGPGLEAYAAKDFDAASEAFAAVADERVSKRDEAKAKRLGDTVGRFEAAWNQGMKSAKAYNAKKAITRLTEARKLDASINGAHQGEIKTTLSKQHAYLASMAYQKGDFGTAGNQARKALALDSGQQAAKKIYTEVQTKAQTWLDQAKQMSDSDPDKAMQLLSKVLSVYPRGDARYKEAYELLNELGEQTAQ
ncbi:MAG: FHA domain-containing protein [Myxococcota bacterium]